MVSVSERITALQQDLVPNAVARDHYGLQVPLDSELVVQIEAWNTEINGGKIAHICTNEAFSRVALERYCQFNSVQPIKVAAARLAMDVASLRAVLERLESKKLLVWRHNGLPEILVEERILAEMHTYFPSIQSRTFSSHSDRCRRIHAAIKASLAIDVVALFDSLSQKLHEGIPVDDGEMPDLASTFDIVSDEPIGQRFQVWLNFGKPASLRPDACSLLTFAKYKELLEHYLLVQREPAVPERIVAYLKAQDLWWK